MVASPSALQAVDADAVEIAESWSLLCRVTQDKISTTMNPLEALERIHRVVYDLENNNDFFVAVNQRREGKRSLWQVTLAHRNRADLAMPERYESVMVGLPYVACLEEAIETLFNRLIKVVEASINAVAKQLEEEERQVLASREAAHYLCKLRKYMGAYDRDQVAIPFESPVTTSGRVGCVGE